MKLANIHIVSRCADARARLIHDRDHAKFGVTIDGKYQDDAIVAAVRPIVVAEIDRRIAELDADLAALGVVLG